MCYINLASTRARAKESEVSQGKRSEVGFLHSKPRTRSPAAATDPQCIIDLPVSDTLT